MKTFRVIVSRKVIEALELEVRAKNREEAEKKAYDEAVDSDPNDWDTEVTDYNMDTQEL
jgi:cytidylate kinase